MRMRTLGAVLVALGLVVPCTPAARAQEGAAPAPAPVESPDAGPATAPVELDGVTLFRVRGVSSQPAAARAETISGRIEALAADRTVSPDSLRIADVEGFLRVVAGDRLVMAVTDADGKVEGVQKGTLAAAHLARIRRAVVDYRAARTREALLRGAALSIVSLAGFLLAASFLLWLARKLTTLLETRYRQRVRSLGIKSFEIVKADRILEGLRRGLRGTRTVALLVVFSVFLHTVLGLFPWTRPTALRLAGLVSGPLGQLGRSVVAQIPNVVFLVVLFLLFRYALGLLRLFFDAVERGTVAFSGFEREWATPTYKVVRLAVIAFGLVVAYPYIPGSSSAAFKGVSLFLGIVFSIGSSSAISNVIAGYALTYRRAFHVGDRVRIGDVTGDVTEIRLQVTHVRTVKNEEVIVPNSQILGTNVVNFSALAEREGVILHTTVGIGYETPWRQVEAMLLLAAERTPDLPKEPSPFVLQRALGDFCVTYELNVYCRTPQRMLAHYAELHRNILDVFNEYGIQIMTPAYEGDPHEPKVVPREQWYAAPAAPPER